MYFVLFTVLKVNQIIQAKSDLNIYFNKDSYQKVRSQETYKIVSSRKYTRFNRGSQYVPNQE